jgi:acetate kinase
MNLSFEAAVKEVIDWLKTNQLIYSLIAIGFRLVMGGPHRYKPEIITEDVLKDIDHSI